MKEDAQVKALPKRKNNVEKMMGDEELRVAYIKVYVKYRLQGVEMTPIDEIPIFNK